MLAFLKGKKTYLLAIAYCVLVLFGQSPEGGLSIPDEAALQKITLAGMVSALRAGVAKARG